ncbi:MAG: hypothetical protein GXO99_05540 [Nitrospirae bacterium]|nr:hypothetical protein [Nitrospirota bacterium]
MKTKAVFIALLIVLLAPVCGIAAENPFIKVTEQIISFFKPLEGDITTKSDGGVIINLGTQKGVKKGMRFRVFERGAPFYHPVTGEYMGRIEKYRGTIEVVNPGVRESLCRITNGDAQKGDLVRISGAKRRMLFYQDRSVDYYVGDTLYQELRRTERFDLVDAPIEDIPDEKLLSLAEKEKVELIVKLHAIPTEDGQKIQLQVLWSDGTVFYKDSVKISNLFITRLRADQQFLSGAGEEALLTYSLPFGAEHLLTGDVDGDKKLDIIMSNGYEIFVYSYDVDLHFLYQAKMNKEESALWLDLMDIDRDGKDEVLVTSITDNEDRVTSYVYKLQDNSLTEIWKTKGFIRAYNGMLLWQEFSPYQGYVGPIKVIKYTDGAFVPEKQLEGLPPGINIYNFVKINTDAGDYFVYIDKYDYLGLINPDGLLIWRSDDDLGGFLREFEKKKYIEMVEQGTWYVPDRLIIKGKTVITIKRNPVAKKARGLGFKSSSVIAYAFRGTGLEEFTLVGDISGNIYDYSTFDDKIAIISKPPLGIRAKNILKGQNPFVIYLQIFSIR